MRRFAGSRGASGFRRRWSAVAPSYEFLLHVDNAQTCWQAFEHGAAYFGIVKKTHVSGSVRTSHQFYRQDAYASSGREGAHQFPKETSKNLVLSITCEIGTFRVEMARKCHRQEA